MSTRADVLIAVDELPAALAAGAQLLDVRWRLGEKPGSGFDTYLQGHLPDARFLDLEAVLTGATTDPTLGRHPLPDIDQLGAGLGALGIDPALPIIVYDEPGSFAAGRAWWVLRWAGLDVRVLDGGIRAWVAAGNLLETEEPPAVFGMPLALTAGHLPTLDADEVAAFDGILIDVRAPERYRGEVEPIDPKAGHIPAAVNRPVSGYWTAEGTLPDEGELRQLLSVPDDRAVAVYCGSGVSAAQVVLALVSLGVDAALYPASWSGWSADPSRPVAVGTQE
ncbi:MAG TPA: sulfurtransferase [Propionicimonas sp.]